MKQLSISPILVLVLSLFCFRVSAQSRMDVYSLDSLLKVNEKYFKKDLTKAKLLNQISYAYQTKDQLKGLFFADFALNLSKKLNSKLVEAEALSNLGLNYLAKGDYDLAISKFEQARNLNLKEGNLFGATINLTYLGSSYRFKKNKAKANELFLESLEIFEKNNLKAGIAYVNEVLGSFYKAGIDTKKALFYYQRSKTEYEELGKLIEVSSCLAEIGIIFRKTNEIDSAIAYHNRALLIRKFMKDSNSIAGSYSNLATCYFDKEEFDLARSYNEKAYAIYRNTGNKKGIALALGNLANIYFYQAEYEKAIEKYSLALKEYEALQFYEGVAGITGNIGLIYKTQLNYVKALDYYQKSFNTSEKIGNKENMAITLTNMGNIYYSIHEFSTSLEYYKRAADLSEQNGSKRFYANAMADMGIAYSGLKKENDALECFKKALEIYQKAKANREISGTLMNIGNSYKQLGNYLLGYTYYERAKTIYDSIGNQRHVAHCDIKIAATLLVAPDTIIKKIGFETSRKYFLASEMLEKANLVLEKYGDSEFWVEGLRELSKAYELQGNYSKAYTVYKSYIQLQDSIIGNETKQKIARKEIEYEFQKKESEYQFQEKLNSEKLVQVNLLSDKQRQLLRLQQNKLVLSKKERELQHLSYLKSQSELEVKKLKLKSNERNLSLLQLENEKQKVESENLLESEKSKSTILILIVVIAFVFLFSFAIIYYNVSKVKQLKEILAVRNSISENLHDDVGSALSSINIMSNMAKSSLLSNPDKAEVLLERLNQTSDEMMGNMRDIVWSINPQNITTEAIVSRMREFAAGILENKNINMQFSDFTNGGLALNSAALHDYYLIFKEAVNNSAKYSEANLVTIEIKVENGKKSLMIRDNGKGFDLSKTESFGNGLTNMQKRAKKIGGRLSIQSQVDIGTSITLFL